MSNNSRNLTLQIRLKLDDVILLGPGKIDLLNAVARTGSISAAARAMGMSYRRAWMLIEEMSRHLDERLVETSFGGKEGGGTQLTVFGKEICARYRRMCQAAELAMVADLEWLCQHAVVPEGLR